MKAYVVYRDALNPGAIKKIEVEEFDVLFDIYEDYRLFYDTLLGSWWRVEELLDMQKMASKVVVKVRPFN